MNLCENYTLGLDLGVQSIGWALLESENGTPQKIVDMGSRVFQTSMDDDSKIESGNAETKNSQRGTQRQLRKMLDRRHRRMVKLRNFLQRNGLLPKGDDPEELFEGLDSSLRKKYLSSVDADVPPKHVLAHTLLYYLRARAIDKPLTPHEFGRAIYHLAQRRGFKSNRKLDNASEEAGVVKEGISELATEMEQSGARTLGEYFSKINPMESRIRERWTSRKMYEKEFNKICDSQSSLLTSEQRKELFRIIFFQRKLKSVKHLIGKCELEPGRNRCGWYRPEAQEFRILQLVNNLRVFIPGLGSRELELDEHDKLIALLNGEDGLLTKAGDLAISKAKNALGLPRGSKFTIEEGDEKKFRGNTTSARFTSIIGEKWANFNLDVQNKAIETLHSFENEKPLQCWLENNLNLTTKESSALSSMIFEEGYCNFSLMALEKLLPLLREGLPLQTAIKQVYPEQFEVKTDVYDLLPGIGEVISDLRNPVVARCLSELRKVVNAVIKKHGKPGRIQVELARDLKKSNKEKQRAIRTNRDNEKSRQEAAKKATTEMGIVEPSATDILKVQLADECNWECPYTLRRITPMNLLGPEPQFDIEHIIPFSRSLDNSFMNKTLCYHEFNRNTKKNRTPYETYKGRDDYDQTLQAVRNFKGKGAQKKLKRFKMTSTEVELEFNDFSERHLNDTRHATKKAMEYVSLLYGGTYDKKRKRVYGLSGGITFFIRALYGMNDILGDGRKSRDDHRHHAVDAVAIAMTSEKTVKLLINHAKTFEKEQLIKRFKVEKPYVPENWPTFAEELRDAINSVVTSHQLKKRIRGALHQETIYTKDYKDPQTGKAVKHVRAAVSSLKKTDIDRICDDGIKRAVMTKLAELGINDPQKAFNQEDNLPVIRKRDGTVNNVIKNVRLSRSQQTLPIGVGNRKREVVGGNNHHMELVAILDDDGNEIKWEGHVISMLDAITRQRHGEPIVRRDFGPGKRFKYSLACGDIIEVDRGDSARRQFGIVRSVPQSKQVIFVSLNEARKQADIKAANKWLSGMPNSFMKMQLQKYHITPLGELRRSND